jgi:site-specific DNA-methyltransferase (adenine-specific)
VSYELRLGSCLDPVTGLASLADKSVDVTITDPPYEFEAHEKGKRQGNVTPGRSKNERGSKVYARVVDQGFDFAPMTEADRRAVSAQIARVTKRLALVFCQVEAVHLWRTSLEDGGLVYRRTIPWVKPDAMPSLHGRWPGQSFEAIVLAMKPGAVAPVGGKARYYSHTRSRGESRAHDTAKPLSLMLEIGEDFTMPGDCVLDCYAGSGTTGVAALRQGCRFVGWELAPCAWCSSTAAWDCAWISDKGPRKAFLCDGHRAEVEDHRGYRARPDNMHAIATRRLNGDEAKPRKEQPGLFDAIQPAPSRVEKVGG